MCLVVLPLKTLRTLHPDTSVNGTGLKKSVRELLNLKVLIGNLTKISQLMKKSQNLLL